MNLRLLLFLLFISGTCLAQVDETLSADSKAIRDAYIMLMREPTLPQNQMSYIATFPSTKEQFFHVFYPTALDQLYKTRKQYLDAIIEVGDKLPEQTLHKILGTAVHMKAADDIVGQLQNLILKLSVGHTDVFITTVKSMWPKDQQELAPFIADTDDPQFDKLVANLKAAKANALANMLTKAHDSKNDD